MKILFNPIFNQRIAPFLNKKNHIQTFFKHQISFDTFEKSNSDINKLFEYLFASNNIVRYVDNNVTAGETLANRDNNFFKQLSNWGIKTIVDLREFDKEYQKKCDNNNIKYVSVPLTHALRDKKDKIFDYTNNGKVKDSFVDGLKTLLEHTKKGNTYFGCQYGVDRTNFALVCDYILNYDTTHRAPKIYPSNYATRNVLRNKNINLVKKIIKRLSNEQRKKLNLPDNFENTILYKRIGEIVKENKKGITQKEILSLGKKINYDLLE